MPNSLGFCTYRNRGANPCRINTYEKYARKSFKAHSYKMWGLEAPSNHTLTKKGWGAIPMMSIHSLYPKVQRVLRFSDRTSEENLSWSPLKGFSLPPVASVP
jgi:hypothetical protein